MPQNDWSTILRSRAADILSRLRAENGETALTVLMELHRNGFQAILDGEQVKVSPGGLSDDLRAKIKKHKFNLMALLRPQPKPEYPIDWQQEWRLEMDSVYRRQATAWSPQAKKELSNLASVKCESYDEWESLYKQLLKTEHSLRYEGELPPIAYVVNGTIQMADGRTQPPVEVVPTPGNREGS